MHVAGTIGANGDPANGGIVGVAPDTQLLAMKVFSDTVDMNYVYTDTVLKAIDDSIKLGADAVNLSLGGRAGFSNAGLDTAQREMYSKTLENGIICAIAVGNDRNSNYNFVPQYSSNPDQNVVGSPATLHESFGVASFNNTHTRTRKLISANDPDRVIYTSIHGQSNLDILSTPQEYVSVGLGMEADYEGINAEGKVVLVERGGGTFTEKKDFAIANGAIGIIIYNHEDGGDNLMNMLIDPPYDIPMIFIGRSDGLYLIENQATNTISIAAEETFEVNPNADTMAIDSSWGPTSDLRMKPEILAPGANIYSTQNDNEYTLMSGTSMATPHVAGGVAVVREYIEKNPYFSNSTLKEKAEMSKLIIMNTAEPKLNEAGVPYSVNQQGAGMMQLPAAVSTPVYITATGTNDNIEDGKLELKDNYGSSFDVNLKLTNMSDQDVTYNIDHIVLKEDINEEGYFTENTVKADSQLTGSNQITVLANSTQNLTFNISYNGIADKQFVTGFIRLIPTDSKYDNLTVPFLGFNGDWNEPRILDGMGQYGEDSNFNFATMASNEFWIELSFVDINGQRVAVFSPHTGVMPVITPLRNAEALNFSIKDSQGNLIVDKLTVTAINKAPDFWWHSFSTWYGETRTGGVAEGDIYNYVLTAKLNYPDAASQTYSYPVTIDRTAPTLEIESVNSNTREIVASSIDNLAGVERIWVYSPKVDDYMDFEVVDELDKGIRASITVPKEFGNELWVCTEDRVWNYTELPVTFEGEILEDPVSPVDPGQPGPEEPNPDQPIEREKNPSDLAQIKMISPEFLGRIGKYIYDSEGNQIDRTGQPITIEGIIMNYYKVEKVIVEEIDPTKSKEEEVLQRVEIPVEDLILNDDGTYSFSTDLVIEREDLIDVRITVIDNGRESGISHKFYLDETPPKLNNLQVTKIDGETIKLDVNLSDNMNYIELQEHIITNVDENGNPWFNFFRTVGVLDKGYEHILVEPVEGDFTTELPIHSGRNVFYFHVWDKVDNNLEFAVEVDGTTGEYKVYDSWALDETSEEDDNKIPDEKPSPEKPEEPKPEDPNEPKPSKPNPKKSKKKEDKKIIEETEEVIIEDEKEEKEDKEKEEIIEEEKDFERLSGKTRYETAIKISQETFDKAETVILASGESYPDALSVAPLAGSEKAPILLVDSTDNIDENVLTEIERLGAKNIIIVGGDKSVSKAYEDSLAGGYEITRLSGKDRYETSYKILLELYKNVDNTNEIFIASGNNFADSLSIAPFAGLNESGVLLLGDKVDEKVLDLLKDNKEVILVGGGSSISQDVEEQIKELNPNVRRIAGENRYITSTKIAEEFFENPDLVVMASGENYPDALAGSVLAMKEEAPILLVSKDNVDQSTLDYVEEVEEVEEFIILGGENTISDSIVDLIK